MNRQQATRLLRDIDSSAYACMRSAEIILGDEWMNWEPESVWITFARQGITVPPSNCAQLLAGRGLLIHGRFWYDAIVFEKTCMALNNEEPTLAGMSEAPVHFMAWAVSEADMINKYYGSEELYFDYECVGYATTRLLEDGYVLTPEQLRWCQSSVDKSLPKEALELKTLVRKAWALSPKDKALQEERIPETPAGVQIAKLGAVDLYVKKRSQRLQLDLASLEA